MSSGEINLSDLLKSIPIGDIAAQFGINESTTTQAVSQALPGLLGGMAVNASSEEGASQLTAALKKHEGAQLTGLDAVDTEDGKKIVKHVLGDKEQDVAMALGAQGGGGLGDIIQKLLPVLAPFVMSFLANKLGGGAQTSQPAQSSGGGIGDLLGGLLGGGSGSASSNAADGGIGDLLGGLLGGGSGANKSGGGLGGLLGGLLGK